MRFSSILDSIGNTPHVRLSRLFPAHEVWLKLERANPGGSIKDRIALAMIEKAEKNGIITAKTTLIEPTSGNTGIGLAMVAAVKGYRLILVMPSSMSLERRRVMAAYGAELVLTPKEDGMKGAIAKAKALSAEIPHSWVPSQFQNPANPEAHRLTTAHEILADFDDGLDFIITGVGTGGHITGVAQTLKQHWPYLQIVAVEPSLSPVLSGGTPKPHGIQGIGAGFIPDILDQTLLDGIIQVEVSEAKAMALRAAREEGILMGISSGASLAAIAQKIQSGLDTGARILSFCYDSGERYLSVPDFIPGE